MPKTVTIKPASNIVIHKCQMPNCDKRASFDTRLLGVSQWAYVCIEHFKSHGTKNLELVNNISGEEITVTI
jgi:hypothetical protein